jgi:hypothetical protein
MLNFCHWLEATAAGTMVRESLYGFPILVAIHIMGLVLSVGTLLWFDLRLTGVALRAAPVSRVYRSLIPWASTGFMIMFASGLLLFTGYAVAAWQNAFFRIKISTLVLAAMNALFYHLVTERRSGSWDTDARPPAAARTAGAISLVLWAAVILCGRIMSYTMY